MIELVKAFYDIALIRRGPDLLPVSRFLLSIAVAVYFSVSLVRNAVFGINWGSNFGSATVDLALMFGWFWALLAMGRRLPRYNQTMTALAGTLALISIAALPLTVWSSTFQGADVRPPLWSMSIVAVLLWVLFVIGHILSKALGMHLLLGVFLAFVYVLTSELVVHQLFPIPA